MDAQLQQSFAELIHRLQQAPQENTSSPAGITPSLKICDIVTAVKDNRQTKRAQLTYSRLSDAA